MNNPIVSILVPVYQVEEYIERCAHSLFGQTYPNIEYVFVDDATPDASMDILELVLTAYPERKRNVHIIRHEQNKGLATVRNTLVEASHGEFVLHVDSDDWMESNAVELLVKRQQETDADIVSAEAYDYYGEGVLKNHLRSGGNLDRESLLKGILKLEVSTSVWRRLIRKSLYDEHNIKCDERGSGGEDFQTLPRLVYYAHTVAGIDTPVYYYNRTNRHSIVATGLNDIGVQLQGLVSARVIISFFSDKETCFRELVGGIDIWHIHNNMEQNAIKGKVDGYNLFLNLMKESDSQYWYKVHWNIPLIRCIESYYHTMIPFCILHHAYVKVKHKIIKITER